MDIALLLDKYFKGTNNVSIDVFDAQTLNAVYRNVVSAMTSHFEIEVSVLQALSYCLYEMMDNVHIHSGKPLGTAITYFDKSSKILRILIADDGMGIKASLAENYGQTYRKDRENVYPAFRKSQADDERRRDHLCGEWLLARNTHLFGDWYYQGNRPQPSG